MILLGRYPMASVGVIVPDGILSDAARESQLQGANKSQVLRFALLRLIMPAKEARATVFSDPAEMMETKGRVDAKIPDHELERVVRGHRDRARYDTWRGGFEHHGSTVAGVEAVLKQEPNTA